MTDPHSPETRDPPPDFVIVGVGASAGGLEPLQTLLGLVPPGSGVAFIVVLHADPSAKHLLPDVLAKATALTVVDAADGVRVRPDHVYCVPGHSIAALEAGVLRLAAAERPEERRTPIDRFFCALAQDQGERAVAVVLSGSGSDGALGLKAVAEACGMTLVQDPRTARHDGMPQSAVATGAADHVQPVERIAEELRIYANHVRTLRQTGGYDELHREVADCLPAICEALLQATGHNFKHYKTSTLTRRVLRRLQVLRVPGVRDYLERLRTDPLEAEHLFKDLLIGVTAFFRDPEAFEALSRDVLVKLLTNRRGDDAIRVWVPGCATGQEAYTIAILLRELLDAVEPVPEVQVFATDLDEHALVVARQGVYPLKIADEVAPERLRRFFVKKGQNYHVAKELRDMVLFSVHNLINDPPFSKLDLISCRNLLIYLGSHLQKKLIPLFHYALKPGGYLFLGPSENLNSHRELFRPIDAKARISQRLPTATRPGPLLTGRSGPPTAVRPPNVPSVAENDTYLLMQRIVLDEFAPKAVIVDDEGQVVCASGNLEKYLTVSAGAFHNSVTRLVRDGLRLGLKASLAEAIKVQRKVVHDGLYLRTDSGVQRVMLTVQPMPQMGAELGLYMVVFQDVGLPLTREESPHAPASEDAAALIEQLERELASTRDDLERTVQDLEAANEEMKSSNEELLSMNEELQSANEELEASKEELQLANDALARVNTDLENLLTSTGIATLFLDGAGNLRRVTPDATAIYNILPGDVGRPLSHFTHRARHMPPLPDPRQIRGADRPIEHEVEMVDGTWYLRRVLPYQTHDGRAEGIVVTFTDVTERKRAEQAVRNSELEFRASFEGAGVGKAQVDPRTLRFLRVNAKLCELTGYTADELCARGVPDITHPEDAAADLARWRRLVAGDSGLYVSEKRYVRKDGDVVSVRATAALLRAADGEPVRATAVIEDITARKAAELALRRSEALFRALVEASSQIVWTADPDGVVVDDSPSWRAVTGQTHEHRRGWGWLNAIHPDDRPRVSRHWRAAVEQPRATELEYRLRRADGVYRDMHVRAVPVADPGGKIREWVGMNIDITERKSAEDAIHRSAERLKKLAEVSLTLNSAQTSESVMRLTTEAARVLVPAHQSVSSIVSDGDWSHANHHVSLSDRYAEWRDHAARPTGEGLHAIVCRSNRSLRLTHAELEAHPAYADLAEGRGGRPPLRGWLGVPLIGQRGQNLGLLQLSDRDGGDFTEDDEFVMMQLANMAAIALENARLLDELREGDRRKDEFLATLAHELRNPLAPLRTGLQVMELAGAQRAEIADYTREMMERQVKHMVRIVDDLLDLSRVTRGLVDLRREHLDLAEAIHAAIETSRPAIAAAGHDLALELPSAPLYVHADPTRVSQVVSNLLHNAAKFTPMGGHIWLSVHTEDDRAVITVRDDGVGIDGSVLPTIFDMFTQANPGLPHATGGLGIGLTLVRKLVALHGGEVSARSAGPGHGATFVVRLPLAPGREGEARARQRAASEPTSTAGARVLIVDDNVDAAETIALLLRLGGSEVHVEHDGPQAIVAALDFAPDLVLLDIGLPSLSGYDVARSIRAQQSDHRPYLVALTGWGQDADRRKAEAAGFDHHLTKPADPAEIQRILLSVVPRAPR